MRGAGSGKWMGLTGFVFSPLNCRRIIFTDQMGTNENAESVRKNVGKSFDFLCLELQCESACRNFCFPHFPFSHQLVTHNALHIAYEVFNTAQDDVCAEPDLNSVFTFSG